MLDIKISSSRTRARRGSIQSAHGEIQTPAFVTVGTKGTVKSLTPEHLALTGTQFVFVNTYHMVLSPGVERVENHGGIHAMSRINMPIITDSGGFQVFSLGQTYAKASAADEFGGERRPSLVSISEDGVEFRSHIDGTKYMFTPEFSIDAQKRIGADFIVAFDEDIVNKASYKYSKESTERTHRWAQRSIEELNRNGAPRLASRSKLARLAPPTRNEPGLFAVMPSMYGVIHGGRFEDLRKWSAETIAGMDFGCLALGGVSVGIDSDQLRNEVMWVSEVLGTDPRPRHLLGIATLSDVLIGVRAGFDTFDCVLPTRYARMGRLYDADYSDLSKFDGYSGKDTAWTIDILKAENKNAYEKVCPTCDCYTCTNYTKSFLHHLYKQRELLAYTLGTIHNLYWIEKFFETIRKSVEEGRI